MICCIICKGKNWRKKFNGLVECRNCGFVRAKDSYFKASPKKLYSKKYFTEYEYTNYEAEKNALVLNFTDRLRKIRKYKAKGRLLEIGCAYGYFLGLAAKYFDTTGVDLDASIVNQARRNTTSKIIRGDFQKLRFKDKFDVICMFDTIEHLKHPEKYLAKAQTLLNKNGIIVIETGDIGAILPRIQKKKWRLIHPPFHLQYFSRASLVSLLRNTGFHVVYKTNFISFFRSVSQTAYRLGIKIPSWVPRRMVNYSFPTYTFDLVFIIARKK